MVLRSVHVGQLHAQAHHRPHGFVFILVLIILIKY